MHHFVYCYFTLTFCFTPEEMFLSLNVPLIPIIWTFQLVFMNAKGWFFNAVLDFCTAFLFNKTERKITKMEKKTSVFFSQWKRKTYKTFASTSKLKIAKKKGAKTRKINSTSFIFKGLSTFAQLHNYHFQVKNVGREGKG